MTIASPPFTTLPATSSARNISHLAFLFSRQPGTGDPEDIKQPKAGRLIAPFCHRFTAFHLSLIAPYCRHERQETPLFLRSPPPPLPFFFGTQPPPFTWVCVFWAAAPKGAMSYRIGGFCPVRTYVRTSVRPPPSQAPGASSQASGA